MLMMRWGMPPAPRTVGSPVTNIRDTSSPHWRGWLKPENRYLVPANSFAEYARRSRTLSIKEKWTWCGSRSTMIGRCSRLQASGSTFNGDRGTKSKPVPAPHNVYGFLTT